ncbi:hypothetical protein ROLI_032870 [Roseobacter fucihabitans]|uniref:Uncharacterized protein n=1 Tax=Roseobacter fucihabitans TaxID=1537242 RepID=A0ABZ2BVW6_9RHOB
MFLIAVLIDALHTALEDTEITLNRVGMDDATAILALAVGGEVVLCDASNCEPPPVYRRLIYLSYAAMSDLSIAA